MIGQDLEAVGPGGCGPGGYGLERLQLLGPGWLWLWHPHGVVQQVVLAGEGRVDDVLGVDDGGGLGRG